MLAKATRATATAHTDTRVKDALDLVRASAQILHRAISDAVTKRAGAAKAEVEVSAQRAKELLDAAKAAVNSQTDPARAHLTEAVAKIEAAQKQLNDALKLSGEACQAHVRKAVADARASVQKVSDAVAARRSSVHLSESK